MSFTECDMDAEPITDCAEAALALVEDTDLLFVDGGDRLLEIRSDWG